MTATSLNSLRTGFAAHDPSDEKMDQIRDLLVGDHVRQTEARLNALETRVSEMERAIGQQLDALNARVEALKGEVGGNHRRAFDDLAKGIKDLSEHIGRIPRS